MAVYARLAIMVADLRHVYNNIFLGYSKQKNPNYLVCESNNIFLSLEKPSTDKL